MWFQRIRIKIFLAMIVTTAVPLCLTSAIIWFQVSQDIEEDKVFAQIRIGQDLKGRIEDYSRALNDTAYQIYSNPDLIESIALGKQFLTDSRTYDTVRDIREFFLGVYNQSRATDILGLYLIRSDGELFGYLFPRALPEMDPAYLSEVLATARLAEGRSRIAIRYESLYGEPVIQFLYPVKYRGHPTGLLVIDIKEQGFRAIAERYNVFYRGRIAITDGEGVVVYHTDPARAGGRWQTPRPDGRTVVVETPLEPSGWRLFYTYEIDPRQLFYRNTAFAMIGVAGLLALVFSMALSYSITKPIVHLHRKMGRIQIGDYGARAEVRTKDEIGFLGNQFNRMAETIQQLIEHDLKLRLMNQETQIRALQAQISPHFLFNTLQMMAGIAEVNHVPDLKLICHSLSSMYRYNMDIHREWVCLRDEIMHIRNYLVIINKRFPGSIRFRLQLEPGLPELPIPKLILQPLVENAVEHGLIPSRRERKLLKISGRADRENGHFYLYVRDNGVGMSESKFRAVQAMLNQDHLQGGEDGEGNRPIGLHNVHARIRLICGETYGITIKSKTGTGTCVILKLPLREKRDTRERGEKP